TFSSCFFIFYCCVPGGYCSIILATNSLILASFFSIFRLKNPVPIPCHMSSFLLASNKSTNKVPSTLVDTLGWFHPHPQPGPQNPPTPQGPKPPQPQRRLPQ